MGEPQTSGLDSSNATWIKEIERNLQDAKPFWKNKPTTKSACIFRVPASLREQSPEHYRPKVVAIGPYNRSDSELLIEDKNKWGCVNYFVTHRSLDLQNWLRDMRSREQEARSYYSEDLSMDGQRFFEMLLLDGCFILHAFEFINDPKVYMGWPSEKIMLDFLLLGNQIPFFVLVQLYSFVSNPEDILFLTFRSFWKNLPMRRYFWNLSSNNPNQVLHLLHSFCLSLVPADQGESIDIYPGFKIPTQIPSATELQDRSAVKFKKINTREMLNIRFRNGVMEIPVLQIDDAINTLLRNVIAFEQCYTPIKPYLTTYAAFMDCLINKESDVKLLERSGILLNNLPTSKDVTFFFSKLGKFRKLSSYLDDIVVDVNKYHNNKWNRWYADLKLNYFSNPWVTLSVVASAFLLILGSIQAYCSLFSCNHR